MGVSLYGCDHRFQRKILTGIACDRHGVGCASSRQGGWAMKWVTRDFVHLDRVASPWLIKRFIDRDAVFVFVPWGKEDRRPADAIPFALPGAEIGPHDHEGTTFAKLLKKYRLDDPALHSSACHRGGC
jgi:hypothetical protein